MKNLSVKKAFRWAKKGIKRKAKSCTAAKIIRRIRDSR